ncbi:MAG: DMT family transporter [Muribaculaceae bacterium]|nr:DMT family transporter [Muribaculaceae bacterium]
MWLTLAFISALLLGLYDACKKHSLRENAVIPILFLNTLFCALIFVPVIILSATGTIPAESHYYIPSPDWDDHKYILIKSALVLSSWILGYYALKQLPLTTAGPINATRPVMTLVGALLIFGESLNGWQWAGVIIAIVSVFFMSRSGRKEGISFSHNRWIYFLFAAAALGAASGLYDKHLMSPTATGGLGINKMAVQSWYNVYQAVMMGIVLLVVWWPKRKEGTVFRWRHSIVFISIFLTAADFVYFYALTFPDAMISVVSMVRRGSVVISFLCGAMFFREKNLKSKSFDVALVLIGLACLWIGTTR